MKISNDTIEILKHYSAINPGIIVDQGNKLFSRAINKTIRSEALIEEEFPIKFAISNLSQFLGAVSFFENPNLEFYQDKVTITDDKSPQKVDYYFSDPELVDQDNKELKVVLEDDVKFSITAEQLGKLNKASTVMGLSDYCLYSKNGSIVFACTNKNLKSSSTYETVVGNCSEDANFRVLFKKNNLKLTDNTFSVSISKKGLSTWVATDSKCTNLKFYIAIEMDSTFGDE